LLGELNIVGHTLFPTQINSLNARKKLGKVLYGSSTLPSLVVSQGATDVRRPSMTFTLSAEVITHF
jgi:hypothetical protein